MVTHPLEEVAAFADSGPGWWASILRRAERRSGQFLFLSPAVTWSNSFPTLSLATTCQLLAASPLLPSSAEGNHHPQAKAESNPLGNINTGLHQLHPTCRRPPAPAHHQPSAPPSSRGARASPAARASSSTRPTCPRTMRPSSTRQAGTTTSPGCPRPTFGSSCVHPLGPADAVYLDVVVRVPQRVRRDYRCDLGGPS